MLQTNLWNGTYIFILINIYLFILSIDDKLFFLPRIMSLSIKHITDYLELDLLTT